MPADEVNTRDIVWTREDGTQVLVTLWSDGTATLAERPNYVATWGPPLKSSFDSKVKP